MSGVHWVSHKRPKELGDTDGAGYDLGLQATLRSNSSDQTNSKFKISF